MHASRGDGECEDSYSVTPGAAVGYTDNYVLIICYFVIYATLILPMLIILCRFWGMDFVTLVQMENVLMPLAIGNAIAVLVAFPLTFHYGVKRPCYITLLEVLLGVIMAVIPLLFVFSNSGWQQTLISPIYCVRSCNGTDTVEFM